MGPVGYEGETIQKYFNSNIADRESTVSEADEFRTGHSAHK